MEYTIQACYIYDASVTHARRLSMGCEQSMPFGGAGRRSGGDAGRQGRRAAGHGDHVEHGLR